MALRSALRNTLETIGNLANYDVTTNVVDTSVVHHSSDISSLEVYDCLNELESLGFIKMLQRTSDTTEKDGKTLRLLNITRKGLEELQPNQR